jgi:hypothetical protein
MPSLGSAPETENPPDGLGRVNIPLGEEADHEVGRCNCSVEVAARRAEAGVIAELSQADTNFQGPSDDRLLQKGI